MTDPSPRPQARENTAQGTVDQEQQWIVDSTSQTQAQAAVNALRTGTWGHAMKAAQKTENQEEAEQKAVDEIRTLKMNISGLLLL